MSLAKYFGEMRTLVGHALPRATVYVYDYGTTDLANLFQDDETTPIDNPMQSDDNGLIAFNVAAGTYDIRCQSGSQRRTYTKVQVGKGSSGGEAQTKVVATINVGQVNVLPGMIGTVPLTTMPARSRIITSWIRMVTGFNDAGAHGYQLAATISDAISNVHVTQNVHATGTLYNAFRTNAGQQGIIDSSSPVDVGVVFDTGGFNALSIFTVGSLIAGIIYEAPE